MCDCIESEGALFQQRTVGNYELNCTLCKCKVDVTVTIMFSYMFTAFYNYPGYCTINSSSCDVGSFISSTAYCIYCRFKKEGESLSYLSVENFKY